METQTDDQSDVSNFRIYVNYQFELFYRKVIEHSPNFSYILNFRIIR